MSTATVAPPGNRKEGAPYPDPQAIAKVREIMATQDPLPAGLRIGVVGGGCSGFQYSMAFENQAGMMDKVFSFDDLKVFVDATSLMYLNGCTSTTSKPLRRPASSLKIPRSSRPAAAVLLSASNSTSAFTLATAIEARPLGGPRCARRPA